MKYRKLRIAWSVVGGLITVLLVVLWVRSYWWVTVVKIPISSAHSLEIGSLPGLTGGSWRQLATQLLVIQRDAGEWQSSHKIPVSLLWGGVRRPGSPPDIALYLPYWLLVVSSMTLAAVPCRAAFGLRFTVRTLLIATTLVAVALGLIVYAIR